MKRCAVAFITGAALIFAIVLAAIPRLHDYVHKGAGADHECAATIFAAGKCDVTTPDIVPSARPVLTTPCSLPIQISHVIAAVPWSILEHAPPAVI